MDVVDERCGGLDVHTRPVVASLVVPGPAGPPRKAVRTCGTMTDDRRQLAAWLTAAAVGAVARERTGVFWKPIWNLLEDGPVELVLATAQRSKPVPGRKTDGKDAEWIADRLRHGLLRASFVPDRAQRELRELTRYRTALIRERAAEVNRLQKVLEGANITRPGGASTVVGVAGRAILAQRVAGETDAAALAELARGRRRQKLPQLERALAGRVGPHQRFLVAQQLAHLDALDELISRVSDEIAERVRPGEALLQRLDTIPGVGRQAAEGLVAEVGTDARRFPTAGHLGSWAGVGPGRHERAGKRRSGRTRTGSPWRRATLIQLASAAARTKPTYLAARDHRLAARRGPKRAALALGHSVLVAVWHLLRDPSAGYHDLGPGHADERNRQAVQRRLVHRLEGLGYRVSLEPSPPAA